MQTPAKTPLATVWILGDQLNLEFAALGQANPQTHRILIVESAFKIRSKKWHIQRAHFVITSMRRFAQTLIDLGFEVDYRYSKSLSTGLQEHRHEFSPPQVLVMEPTSFGALKIVQDLGCEIIRSNQFLCHYDEFADWKKNWLSTRKTFKMEDFYRWQRRRLNYLIDASGQPETGVWNYDSDNRQPPPKDGGNSWPAPVVTPLDDLDRKVIAELRPFCVGQEPTGLWATSRHQALQRLAHFIDNLLPLFGPHEDAMTTASWHLAHSLLSPYLNIGLLGPQEVCDAVQLAYTEGKVDIASAEGFIRQVIGWREYVWGLYWDLTADYAHLNALSAYEDLPPVFTGQATTQMRCVSQVLGDIDSHAYAHHIARLMIIGNLCLIAGIDPRQLTDWMWANFIDGAEWVMIPNVIGMSQYADGGIMSTKPYASGGAYIDKMSNYCKGCAFDRTKRVGDDACPFTTLYWDFMARHEKKFERNPRIAQQVRAAFRLTDLDQVRERAVIVRARLAIGDL